MQDNILYLVQELLETEFVKNSSEYTSLINRLASDHLTLDKASKGRHLEDIIPDIDNIRYKSAVENGIYHIKRNSFENIRDKLQDYLIENHHENFINITSDRTARDIIENSIKNYCIENGVSVENKNINETVELLTKDILDYRVLTDLIFDYDRNDDEKIEEIRVDDYNDIRIVIKGQVYRTNYSFSSPEELFAVAQKICRNGRGVMVKTDRPFVRLRLGNNIRISIMINPVARSQDNANRPVVQMTIRKQKNKPFSSQFLVESGSVNQYGDKLIEMVVKAKVSTAFYGGTNSGKTATMNSYVHRIDKDNRTISIAEIDEMNLRDIDIITQKAVNSALMWEIQPKYGLGFREAVNYSLTFTPETLVLQEIKGAETVDVIDASITGHQVITTLHASNIKVFGKRILGMYKQSGSDLTDDLILEYVAEAFDLLIRMKLYEDGKRRVSEITELLEYNRKENKFITRTLVRFQVEDTIECRVKDNHCDSEIVKKKIIGKYIAVDFISDELKQKILENGTSKKTLNQLEKMYHEFLKEK